MVLSLLDTKIILELAKQKSFCPSNLMVLLEFMEHLKYFVMF